MFKQTLITFKLGWVVEIYSVYSVHQGISILAKKEKRKRSYFFLSAHCKYLGPNYDQIAAYGRTTTAIPWFFPPKDSEY